MIKGLTTEEKKLQRERERERERESWTVREAKAQSDSDATQPCCQQNSSITPAQQRQ
jgi:hypothetical protein